MGLDFNKIKDKVIELNQERIEKKELEKELNKENPEYLFHMTKQIGNLEIDSVNKIVKFKNYYTGANSKSKITLGSTLLSVSTAGLSTIVRATANAVSKKDKYLWFSDIIGFELYEDDSQISQGGLGSAVAGGLLLGGVGAIVGGVTGKRTSKRVVESMIITITTNDIDDSIVMIPLISISTKTSSAVYKDAFNKAQSIMSVLNAISQQQ